MTILFIAILLMFQTAQANVSPTASFSSDQIESVTIQTDNDFAFHSKLDLIENAKSTIKMIYFIYNNDYSSAFLTQKLMEAAERGVKVQVLLDYMTNYPRIDFFSMVEKQARLRAQKAGTKGSIEFRFYNRPSKSMILTAGLITTGCGSKLVSTESRNDCSDEKLKKLDQQYFSGAKPSQIAWENKYNVMNRQILNSGLFLSGLYSHNLEVLSLATKDLQDNLKKQLGSEDSGELTEDDKEGLKQFFGLIWDSFTGDNFFVKTMAKLKLAMAYTFMSEDVNPITNIINGLIPYRAGDSLAFQSIKDTRIKDLDHLTDYTHHKLLLVDGKKFQLGGRNIEDSYHVSQPDHTLTTKYLFMDTDAVVKLRHPSTKMVQSFNRMFHFTHMTARLDEIRQHAPNTVVANLEHIKKICSNDNDCIANAIKSKKHFLSLKQRMELAYKEFKSYSNKYQQIKAQDLNQKLGVNDKDPSLASSKKLTNHNLHFSSVELRGAKIEYLENLHLNPENVKTTNDAKNLTSKLYGTPRSLSTRGSHKNIHAAIYESIEKACAISRHKNKNLDVVIHNAYFAPPAKMLESFSKLSHGDWKCPKLSVKILTNSVDTTDLAVINLFGRREMASFFNLHEQVKNKDSSAFRYSEYQSSPNSTDNVKYSLHSKVYVLGEDIIVGSANADYRSFMMDTNNAIRIKNAPLVVNKYMQYFKKIPQNIKDRTLEFSKLKATTNIPPYLLDPYKDSLKKGQIFSKNIDKIELIDTLDHAFVEQALKDLNIQHEAFTPRWQAEVKLGAIKILNIVENRTYSIISKWGSEFNLYKQQYDRDLRLCMQTKQPITKQRCHQTLQRETDWLGVLQRRDKQRRNDAKSLDRLFKYI